METKKDVYTYDEVNRIMHGMSDDDFIKCHDIYISVLMGEFDSAKDAVALINSCLGEVRY